MTRGIAARAVLLACLVSVLLAGCGSDSSDSSASGGTTTTTAVVSEEGVSGCVIADVSQSTEAVRTQPTALFSRYVDTFGAFATDIGTNGSGRICVILAAGNPIAEGRPVDIDVGPTPEHRESPDYRGPEVRNAVVSAQQGLTQVFADPGTDQPGSALVEAAVVAADRLKPGDRLLILSDGVEHTPVAGSFRTADLSPSGITTLLDRFDARGMIAHLDGVQVEMPHLGEHFDAGDGGDQAVSGAQAIAIRAFWQAWRDRTHAASITFAPRAPSS